MRLRGGRCSVCGIETSCSVLWSGHTRFLRLWCCDLHAAQLDEHVCSVLTLAAAELELERAPQLTRG